MHFSISQHSGNSFLTNPSLMHCKFMMHKCFEEAGNEHCPETTLSCIAMDAKLNYLNFQICDTFFIFPKKLQWISYKSVTYSLLINDVQMFKTTRKRTLSETTMSRAMTDPTSINSNYEFYNSFSNFSTYLQRISLKFLVNTSQIIDVQMFRWMRKRNSSEQKRYHGQWQLQTRNF